MPTINVQIIDAEKAFVNEKVNQRWSLTVEKLDEIMRLTKDVLLQTFPFKCYEAAPEDITYAMYKSDGNRVKDAVIYKQGLLRDKAALQQEYKGWTILSLEN